MLFHLELKIYKFQGRKNLNEINPATYLLSQCLLMAKHMFNDLWVEIDDETHRQGIWEDEDCYYKELVLRCRRQVIEWAAR
jgi:hypothetical protein